MTDILNQIDGVLADVTACACGCGRTISEKGPSGDFYGETCQARWAAQRVGARAECPWPLCPACGRRMDVVGRYCGPCAIALSGPITGDFGPVPRPSFTLADMEAASEAVRARRRQIADLFDVPHELVEPGPGTFLPLGEVSIRPWTQDGDGHVHLVAPAPPVDAALEPAGVECCGHTTPGLLGTRLLFCTEPLGHEGDHRDDSGCSWSEIPRHSDSGRWHVIGTGDQVFESPCDCPQPVPWWRRMLGGTR